MKQIRYLDINSVVLSIVASDQQTLPCLCRSRGTLIWRTSWCLRLFPVSELCNRHCSQGLNSHELFSFFSRVQHSWFDTNWTSNLWMYCLYDDIWFTHTVNGSGYITSCNENCSWCKMLLPCFFTGTNSKARSYPSPFTVWRLWDFIYSFDSIKFSSSVEVTSQITFLSPCLIWQFTAMQITARPVFPSCW